MPHYISSSVRRVSRDERYYRILAEKIEADKALDRMIDRIIYGPQGTGRRPPCTTANETTSA